MAILALPTFLIGLDLTVLHMATPSIAADLRPSPTVQLWIVDSYGFAVAGLLLTMGNVGDRIGRRRLLMIGAAAFGVASVLAAFAPTAEWLVAARVLLGVGGATLMPSTLSLIRDLYPDAERRRRAISVWMASLLTGTAAGPLVGGLVLEAFWWGAAFLLAVPVMVLLLLLGPFLLPPGRPEPGAERPIDLLSVALSLGGVLGVVYAVKQSAAYGFAVVPILVALAGVAAGTVFVRRQRRLAHPLLDVTLFADTRFSTATTTHLGALLALGGVQYLFALYLQLGLGYSPVVAGLFTLPGAALGLTGAVLSPYVAQRLGSRTTFVAALVLAALGMAVLALASVQTPVPAVAGFAIVSFGVGLVTTLTTDHIVGAAPPERAGMASGISETAAELGIALGVALLGSVATAVQAAGSSDPLTGGAGVDVREAFTDGLQTSAGIAAVIMLALAALCARYLRPAPTSGRSEVR